LGNTRSILWFAGAAVGTMVLAGKKITGACRSSVSTAGGTCIQALRLKKTTVREVAVKPPPARDTRGGLRGVIVRVLKFPLVPITMIRAQSARLLHAAARDTESEPKVAVVASPKTRAKQPATISVARVTPAKQPRTVAGPTGTIVGENRVITGARKPAAEPSKPTAAPSRPESRTPVSLPPYRREKVIFPPVRPEDADAAEFAGIAQKIIFKRALSDLLHPDDNTRVEAASVAERIRHPLSVQALAAQLSRDESAKVRKVCVTALAALNMEAGLPAVENALEDVDTLVRLAAVMAVYRLGGVRGAPALTRVLSDPSTEVRRMAVSCIGWLGQENLSKEVVPLLKDASVPVRLGAVEALGNLRAYEVFPAVIECLGDGDAAVRKRTFAVLQKIAGKNMSERYPEDNAERGLLMARWRYWWRDEAGGRYSTADKTEPQ